jgi:hypothetical protein
MLCDISPHNNKLTHLESSKLVGEGEKVQQVAVKFTLENTDCNVFYRD